MAVNPAVVQIGKVAVGVAAGVGAGYATEKLWAAPLRKEAGKHEDNGLAHIGASTLALAPAGALLKMKVPNAPFLREAMLGASLGAGLVTGWTGLVEGFRGIQQTDAKFIVPWLMAD